MRGAMTGIAFSSPAAECTPASRKSPQKAAMSHIEIRDVSLVYDTPSGRVHAARGGVVDERDVADFDMGHRGFLWGLSRGRGALRRRAAERDPRHRAPHNTSASRRVTPPGDRPWLG